MKIDILCLNGVTAYLPTGRMFKILFKSLDTYNPFVIYPTHLIPISDLITEHKKLPITVAALPSLPLTECDECPAMSLERTWRAEQSRPWSRIIEYGVGQVHLKFYWIKEIRIVLS